LSLGEVERKGWEKRLINFLDVGGTSWFRSPAGNSARSKRAPEHVVSGSSSLRVYVEEIAFQNITLKSRSAACHAKEKARAALTAVE
jgi:hypothetical protein